MQTKNEKATVIVVKKTKKETDPGDTNNLIITNVHFRDCTLPGKIKAFASITLNNAFVIHDIRVVNGEDGYFISFPSKKDSEGKWKDVCHPINGATREMFNEVILKAFKEYERT